MLNTVEVKAYAAFENSAVWLVNCPHCGKVHSHGVGDGPRWSHCFKDSYDLVYAGLASDEMLEGRLGARWRTKVKLISKRKAA